MRTGGKWYARGTEGKGRDVFPNGSPLDLAVAHVAEDAKGGVLFNPISGGTGYERGGMYRIPNALYFTS